MNREDIVESLREGVRTVTFTKVNGEERVMDCTLKMDMIPESMHPKTDDQGVQATINVVRAYDVKAEGWRSFRVENVTNFT